MSATQSLNACLALAAQTASAMGTMPMAITRKVGEPRWDMTQANIETVKAIAANLHVAAAMFDGLYLALVRRTWTALDGELHCTLHDTTFASDDVCKACMEDEDSHGTLACLTTEP